MSVTYALLIHPRYKRGREEVKTVSFPIGNSQGSSNENYDYSLRRKLNRVARRIKREYEKLNRKKEG